MFICKNCGYKSVSWIGKCPECGEWNSFEKEADNKKSSKSKTKNIKITKLSQIDAAQNLKRIQTGINQVDKLLGGGIVQGEIILLSGEPGVGKSTLLLQAVQNIDTLYISGEESLTQIKNRANRLKVNLNNVLFSEDTTIESIIESVIDIKNKIELLVIDSIQTLKSEKEMIKPGSIGFIKAVVNELIKLGKENNIAVLIIGHITKEGNIAGPKTLEHMVDTVLSFEGDKSSEIRTLRAKKNRYGSTQNIAIFKMESDGLKEVTSSILFSQENKKPVIGNAIVGLVEGKRPLFIEVQSLMVPTYLSIPRRVVKGLDYNKVQILLAVIRKQLRIPLDKFDIYINIVGGIKTKSTAIDLGIIASLISIYKNKSIDNSTVFIGEVDLLGNVRKVNLEKLLLEESKKLKFKKIIYHKNCPEIKKLPSLI